MRVYNSIELNKKSLEKYNLSGEDFDKVNYLVEKHLNNCMDSLNSLPGEKQVERIIQTIVDILSDRQYNSKIKVIATFNISKEVTDMFVRLNYISSAIFMALIDGRETYEKVITVYDDRNYGRKTENYDIAMNVYDFVRQAIKNSPLLCREIYREM